MRVPSAERSQNGSRTLGPKRETSATFPSHHPPALAAPDKSRRVRIVESRPKEPSKTALRSPTAAAPNALRSQDLIDNETLQRYAPVLAKQASGAAFIDLLIDWSRLPGAERTPLQRYDLELATLEFGDASTRSVEALSDAIHALHVAPTAEDGLGSCNCVDGPCEFS